MGPQRQPRRRGAPEGETVNKTGTEGERPHASICRRPIGMGLARISLEVILVADSTIPLATIADATIALATRAQCAYRLHASCIQSACQIPTDLVVYPAPRLGFRS